MGSTSFKPKRFEVVGVAAGSAFAAASIRLRHVVPPVVCLLVSLPHLCVCVCVRECFDFVLCMGQSKDLNMFVLSKAVQECRLIY